MGFFYSGGGEKVAIRQALGLRKRGHEVKVFSPIIYLDKCYPELAKVAPQRLVPHLQIPFPFRESSAILASAILPFGMEKAADCDVLLCHSQPSMWLGLRLNAIYGLPYVGYLHQLTTFLHPRPPNTENWNNTEFLLLNGIVGKVGKPLARIIDKICHTQASSLLFNSKWTGKQFNNAYGVRGQVCYPGIDWQSKITTSRKDQLVIAARHLPWKRIDLAFPILSGMKAGRPSLMVTGQKTEYTEVLRRKAAEQRVADRVTFTDYVDTSKLMELFSESRSYIQTSVFEPFGMSIIEAQRQGTPAVVWGDAGAKETILDGETGFYAKPYDIGDFSSKLDTLYDPVQWERMSHEAERWASTFTWKAHLDLLEDTLAEARR